MIIFIAAILVILFVSQTQVDILLAAPSTSRTIKLVMLVISIIAILFFRFR